MEKGLRKKGVRKDASAKGLGPCDRVERRVYPKEEESVFTVKGGKRGSAGICGRPITKRIYSSLQVTANVTSTFRGKKGW